MRRPGSLRDVFRRHAGERVPCVPSELRVYTYELEASYQPSGDPERDLGDLAEPLRLPSRTFYAVREFFAHCVSTQDPADAGLFFVPLNLILFQFRNEDPREAIATLEHLGERRDHVLVAAGDFSNRSKRNHQGEAYREIYDWLGRFVLLAHESTGDLIEGQDIGVIPYHALGNRPFFNTNHRPLLYSFMGELDHVFLPPEHVRSRMARLDFPSDDVFVGASLDAGSRERLRAGYPNASDDFELVSRNSVFTLAPAGYGRWSYRFFQAIQWGSIPVLLSDGYVKPFADSIPYDEFSITIAERDIEDLDSILRSFSEADVERYQRSLAQHQGSFTERAFFTHLTRALEAKRG
jgi:hypothetical protein